MYLQTGINRKLPLTNKKYGKIDNKNNGQNGKLPTFFRGPKVGRYYFEVQLCLPTVVSVYLKIETAQFNGSVTS